jgi:hypothetical protein
MLNEPVMNFRRGGALIELLVVIAIIVERGGHDWSDGIRIGVAAFGREPHY